MIIYKTKGKVIFMKKIKKIISLALVLTLAVTTAFSMSGCSKKKNSGAAGAGATAAEILASMPENLKGTTITFLNWYDPYERDEGAIIDAFEKETGCKVEVIVKSYGEEYNSYLATAVANGDAPDVFRIKEPDPDMLKMCEPLSSTNFEFSYDVWDKEVMENYSVNGIAYGMNLKKTPFFLPSILFYSTDVIEQMGYEDPYELWQKDEWTWEVLEEMCDDWVKQGEVYKGINFLPRSTVALTRGVDFVKYDGGKYTSNLSDKKVLEAWEFTTQMQQDLLLDSGNAGAENRNPTLLFAYMDATALQAKSTYFRQYRKSDALGVVPMPAWETKEDYAVPMMEYLAFGVAKGAKNPEAVPYFLSYYLNVENYNMDSFFYNDHCKEVYEELMAMENKIPNASNYIIHTDINDKIGYNEENLYLYVEPTNITKWLGEREYLIEDKIATANDTLSNCKGQK